MRTQHWSHSVRPCEPSLRALGVAEGRPRGGTVHCCEGRLSSGAPSPPAAHPLGGLSRPTTPVLWARVCGCGGPPLSSWLAYPAGAACCGCGGRPSPGGVAVHCCEGRASGVRRCPSPGRPSSGAGSQGSATRMSRVRLVWACGPSTGPTACALASCRGALRGWRKGVPGGGALLC